MWVIKVVNTSTVITKLTSVGYIPILCIEIAIWAGKALTTKSQTKDNHETQKKLTMKKKITTNKKKVITKKKR